MRAFLLLVLSASALLAAEGSPAATGAAWPPPEFKKLPADYLDRMRRALQLLSDGFDAARNNRSEPDVVRVRAGIAALALGQHVDECNAVFGAEGFGWTPSKGLGFSLFSASYVRLYALFNDRTGVMQGRLAPKAQDNLEQSFWACAKAHSKLSDARKDVWILNNSENHHVTAAVSNFLVAQFLKDIPAYGSLKYDDGSTAKEQYEARLVYWNKWFDEHARKGLFQEDGSSYENYTLEAIFNLRDFAEDPILRRKADMFLDLFFANCAEEMTGSVRGGPKHRTKEDHFESRCYGLIFDLGDGRTRGDYMVPTSDYHPSTVIVSLARDANRGAAYSWSKLCPSFNAVPEGDDPHGKNPLDTEFPIIRNGFVTSRFHMGSYGCDTSAKLNWQARQQRWQGVMFANNPLARISMDGKCEPNKGDYISNAFKTIQDRNVMVTVKWGPVADDGVDPNLWIYFSSALDLVEEEQGWIFVKSGEAFAGVKVVDGYEWVEPWQHRDAIYPKSYVRMLNEHAPVITVANDAADYNNDFGAFKKALMAEPVAYRDGVLNFATISHEGPLKAGQINGKPVVLKPPLLNNSPFIRSDWDSGVIYIRKGDETLKLDFSDPNNPRRTAGGPTTAGFPAGVGDSKPVVFRESSSPGGK